MILIVILFVIVAAVFIFSEPEYQKLEQKKRDLGGPPTPAHAAADAGVGCLWLSGWIGLIFVGFLVLVAAGLVGV